MRRLAKSLMIGVLWVAVMLVGDAHGAGRVTLSGTAMQGRWSPAR
jgi:hypothetical protein